MVDAQAQNDFRLTDAPMVIVPRRHPRDLEPEPFTLQAAPDWKFVLNGEAAVTSVNEKG
jgi:hypothetical protein